MASPIAATAPYWVPALSMLMIYRRVRRNFGVQPWRPVRSGIRLGVLVLVAAMLCALGALQPSLALGLGIGATLGALLGLLALKHTHVAWRDDQRTYTPNPWIGGALAALLVGRIAWRYTHEGFAATQAPSALTMAMATVLIGYSLVYVIGLMVQMRRLAAERAATSASTPPVEL
ncbi:hypothetical protein RDV84_14795 [Lysobacter yananisis]|uniref:DUF1453 domain-containing protein n=1 Tax=Lysobacter yananisis TaxID=1003114 RepID=A0ABY9P2R4_9GAMM|nr:hypothetical protein [Lysobacter yananisis]WMT01262.1 hypothetical protein RDV84_14795 [Lysobacter yananisis]